MTPMKGGTLNSLTHFKITQASLISALTFIVGQLVAFVPTLGPDKQNLISGGSTVIAVAFLIANAIHAKAAPAAVSPELAKQIAANNALSQATPAAAPAAPATPLAGGAA